MHAEPTVEGESAVELMTIFRRKHFREDRDGTVQTKLVLSPEEATPFERALMRVEAELLLDDARRVGTPDEVYRTPPQRRADALIALVLRTAAALEAAGS